MGKHGAITVMAASPQAFITAFRASRQRSAQRRLREERGMGQHIGALAAVRKPHVPAYVFLAVIALVLDLLDFAETPGDATVILFFVQALVEISFFLLIKALIGRSSGASWILMLCVVGIMVFAVIPFVGQVFGLVLMMPIAFAAFSNRNVRIVERSKESLVARMTSLDLEITRYAARVERLARTAARMGKRLERASRTIRGARIAGRIRLASRRITKASRTVNRALGGTIGNMIPVIEIIPFQLWTVYGTYRDQLNGWKEAQALLAEYQEKVAEQYRLEEEEAALTALIAGRALSGRASVPRRQAAQDVMPAPQSERAPPTEQEFAYAT